MLFYLPHLTSYPPPKAIFSFVGWKKNIIDNFFTLRNFRKKHRVVHTSTWRRCSFFLYCTHFEIYYHEIKLLQFFFVYLFHVFLFIIEKLCREYQNMRILKFFLLHLTAILCQVRDKINFLLLQWKKGLWSFEKIFIFHFFELFSEFFEKLFCTRNQSKEKLRKSWLWMMKRDGKSEEENFWGACIGSQWS